MALLHLPTKMFKNVTPIGQVLSNNPLAPRQWNTIAWEATRLPDRTFFACFCYFLTCTADKGYSKQKSSLLRVFRLLYLYIAPVVYKPKIFLGNVVSLRPPPVITNAHWTNTATMVTVEWHLSFKHTRHSHYNNTDFTRITHKFPARNSSLTRLTTWAVSEYYISLHQKQH